MMKPLLLLIASVIILQHVNGQCARRDYDHDSFVCVCNATYCDEAGVVTVPAAGTYAVYTSTRDALRLEPTTGEIEATPDAGGVAITVDTTNQYQTIIGFGSSFSDSAALNLNTLSDAARDNVLRSYFAAEGAEFTVSRVTIGGSDFSTRPYSLDDVEGDIALEFWSLAPEDIDAKIPNILRAMEISSSEIFILGSPWSPPAWMKSTGEVTGLGYLLPAMRQPYANFMVKWIDAYEAAGVPVWGFTPQNEPLTDETVWTINACKWLPEDMRDYIRDFLGPTLEAAGYADKKLMVFDFNRDKLPDYVMPLLSDPECSKYIAGVAAHWYVDDFIGPEVLLATRDLDPTKFILHTEASTGVRQENPDSVYLGDWLRAEHYLYDILENLNYYSTGWVDWNMALDLNMAVHVGRAELWTPK